MEREKGARRGPLTGDVGRALDVWGAVRVRGAGCAVRGGRTGAGCGEIEGRVDPGGCVGICWAGRVHCEVEAAPLDQTSQAVTDYNTKRTVTTHCSQTNILLVIERFFFFSRCQYLERRVAIKMYIISIILKKKNMYIHHHSKVGGK